jgi:hypothetical protein
MAGQNPLGCLSLNIRLSFTFLFLPYSIVMLRYPELCVSLPHSPFFCTVIVYDYFFSCIAGFLFDSSYVFGIIVVLHSVFKPLLSSDVRVSPLIRFSSQPFLSFYYLFLFLTVCFTLFSIFFFFSRTRCFVGLGYGDF